MGTKIVHLSTPVYRIINSESRASSGAHAARPHGPVATVELMPSFSGLESAMVTDTQGEQMRSERRDYIFGYGSIINSESRASSGAHGPVATA